MSMVGLHVARQAEKAKCAFIYERGMLAALDRQSEIEALPAVEWKGKPLRTLRCHGTSGKGPHDCNVPEGLLWSLIDLRAFRCPYHANNFVA